MIWPNEMSGSHPLAGWCNKLLKAAKAHALKQGVGYTVTNTSDGASLVIGGTAGAGQSNPFRIYRSDNESLKFMVAAGYVVTTGAEFQPTNLSVEHTVTVGEKKWLSLQISSTTASVVAATTQPTYSVSLIPIGWVSASSSSSVTVFQFLRNHVFIPCA